MLAFIIFPNSADTFKLKDIKSLSLGISSTLQSYTLNMMLPYPNTLAITLVPSSYTILIYLGLARAISITVTFDDITFLNTFLKSRN